jgi:hypothetical protein
VDGGTSGWLIGPGPSGSIRYADVVVRDGVWWIYHEVTRPDGAHELRLARAAGPERPARSTAR